MSDLFYGYFLLNFALNNDLYFLQVAGAKEADNRDVYYKCDALAL